MRLFDGVLGETGAVRVVQRQDADAVVAVLDDQVGQRAGLQHVRRRRTEVQTVVVVVREVVGRVRRRELQDAGAGDRRR